MIINESGGGAGINLKVVGGTTQPTSPAENTVWVNTSTAISGYVFSAAEPESPTEGLLWIQTGTSASVPINIHRKNTLMVYPTACRQYVSGAWVSREAKTYKDGEWVEWWTGMLFDNGDEYTAITGGFSGVGSFQKAENADGYLHLLAEYGKYGAYLTENAIDLTDFSTLTAIVKTSGSTNKMLGIVSTRSENFTAYTTFLSADDSTVSLDISQYYGLYYVGIQTGYNNSIYAKQIKLEV